MGGIPVSSSLSNQRNGQTLRCLSSQCMEDLACYVSNSLLAIKALCCTSHFTCHVTSQGKEDIFIKHFVTYHDIALQNPTIKRFTAPLTSLPTKNSVARLTFTFSFILGIKVLWRTSHFSFNFSLSSSLLHISFHLHVYHCRFLRCLAKKVKVNK
jgi:hypothetical protein